MDPSRAPPGPVKNPQRTPEASLRSSGTPRPSNPPILRSGSGGMREALESAAPKGQGVWNGYQILRILSSDRVRAFRWTLAKSNR